MGLVTSKYSYSEEVWRNLSTDMYNNRAHTNILVVGEKSSGKTELTKKITNVTKVNKSWIHIFDQKTTSNEDSVEKIKELCDNGIDTSGLSILETNLPPHGIIWVIDATKMNTIEDFNKVCDLLIFLSSISKCMTYLFFSHTDIANRTSLNYIKALYVIDSDIPQSGEFVSERIFYAPLTQEINKDTDYTILRMIVPVTDWARALVS